jgi:hypothetical protein
MPMGCGRGIHDSGFRLHPGSDHFAAHGTGGKTNTWIATYPFDLPSVREGVDIQDAMLFSKPYRGLDGCPISFDTLQVEILLRSEGGQVLVMHRNTFMLDVERRRAVHSEDDASALAAQEAGTDQPSRD